MSAERAYRDRVDRVRAQVRATVPEGSRVLVISRGDEALLRLERRNGEHFPQSPTGLFAGHYPADGAEAVAHLRELRAGGAGYLVVPAEARWWLEHYPELREALAEEGELLAGDAETADVYALARRRRGAPDPSALEAERIGPPVGSLLRALLPDRAGVVLIGQGADAIDLGDRRCWRLPPEPFEPVLARARAARSEGARFVVLLHPERASAALDGRYRPAFAESMGRICRQRLVEVFEAPA
jgi:hypothetical protein